MELRLKRNDYESAAGYSLGRLFVDEGGFFCWILEPENRGLHQDMPLPQIKARKVAGKTAIPAGRYKIQVKVSPSFKDKYYGKKYGGKYPYLSNVPGFDAIMIHPGNLPSDTRGCLLPGMLYQNIRGRVFDSVSTYQDLMDFYIWPAYLRKEEIWLTIE